LQTFKRFDRLVLGGVVAYVALLALAGLVLPDGWLEPLLVETGPLERVALAGWLGAAALLVLRIRPFTSRTLAFTLVCLLCAAREADWQKAFTPESISRLNYYRRGAAPLIEKLVAAAAVLLFIGLMIYAAVVAIRFLYREGGLRSRSGLWLLIGACLLVLGKALDRSAGVLAETLAVTLPPLVEHVRWALEEGAEAATPLAFALSAWISQDERRYLS
jgi:hypothetical protein